MSKNKTKTPKEKNIDEKVKAYISKEKALLESLGLKVRLIISFGSSNGKPTFWQRFAVFLLSAKGGFPDIEFSEKAK